MFCIPWRAPIIPIAVRVPNLTVTPMDDDFPFLIFGNVARRVDGLRLLLVHAGGLAVARTLDGPAVVRLHDVLILAHAQSPVTMAPRYASRRNVRGIYHP